MFKGFQLKLSTPVHVVVELVEVVEVVEAATEIPLEEVHKELRSKEEVVVVVVKVKVEVADKEEAKEEVVAVVVVVEVEEVVEDVATEITVRQSRPATWPRSTRSARA